VIRPLALLVVLLVPGCGGSSGAGSEDPPRCEIPFAVPEDFERLDTFEEPYADRVGIRVGFRDDAQRELHVLVGIPGEFGEGATLTGEVEIAGGASGALFASVPGTWTLVWETGDPCDPRAVIGNGFTRDEFLGALAEAGLVAPGG
jgi:hypothetical protein